MAYDFVYILFKSSNTPLTVIKIIFLALAFIQLIACIVMYFIAENTNYNLKRQISVTLSSGLSSLFAYLIFVGISIADLRKAKNKKIDYTDYNSLW